MVDCKSERVEVVGGPTWRLCMRGDDDAASTPSNVQIDGSFSNAGLYWRMAIVAAGPAANSILGIFLFAGVYMSVGKQTIPAIIGEIMPNTPAASAGLSPVIKFWKLMEEWDFNDMRGLVLESPGKALAFVEGSRDVDIIITPETRFNEQLQINIAF